jgi:antitoxin (DNA-binding transcriptional repressor) of toxin-antitoxin stability system
MYVGTETNMRDATFTELRSQAKRYFELVESGEVVRVLRHGKPIAEIHPLAHDLPSWRRRPARPLVIGGRAVSRRILEDRGD